MGQNKPFHPAQGKPKGPRSVKRRTLPPDAKSLRDVLCTLSRKLAQRGDHLKREPHDYHARRGFQALFDQRAATFRRLCELDPKAALDTAAKLGLVVAEEVTS